ncbi:MAG: hypothetical protein JW782_07835 [Candidatus Saganbacteria bacterium]|nr:hypothetical protein [Candidatus Saganbacteria bacterium]
MTTKLLFITNGHGEDLVAAAIIKQLNKNFGVTVLPVVGEGQIFRDLDVTVLGPKRSLPSGGFSLRNLLYLGRDIYAGLLGNTLAQLRRLKEQRGKIDLTIATGDIVPIIGALVAKAPFVFVGVNKSAYYKSFGSNYTPWERIMLHHYCRKVFVRDKVTENELKRKPPRVPQAEYVGNPLMDCFRNLPKQPRDPSTRTIGFLPGTRDDAVLNLVDFQKVIEEILKIKNNDDQGLRFLTAAKTGKVPEYFENLPFAEVLARSEVIIGLSGTGNEQAAGAGVPLISFYGRGSQYNKRFALAQKQLLGKALYLIKDHSPITVAAEVWHLLRNPDKLKRMADAGQERMGSSGAVEKIVEYLKEMG